jgi:hypothetical protein
LLLALKSIRVRRVPMNVLIEAAKDKGDATTVTVVIVTIDSQINRVPPPGII